MKTPFLILADCPHFALSGITGSFFHVFAAAEAEFVAQIHSHLCDTASKKNQHYGELNLTPPPRNTHPHTRTKILYFFVS